MIPVRQLALAAVMAASCAARAAESATLDNPRYSELAGLAHSPVKAAPGDVSNAFTAPDRQVVTVTIKSPVTTKTYIAPAMAPGQKSADYIQQQLVAAGSGSILMLPRATYDFGALNCKKPHEAAYSYAHVHIEGFHDLTIDAQGSTFNFASPCSGFALIGDNRIVLKNLVIDWPHSSFAAVATVTAVGHDTFDLQVDPGRSVDDFAVVTAWDRSHGYWSLTAPRNEIYYPTANPYRFGADGSAHNLPSHNTPWAVGDSVLVRHLEPSGAGAAVETGRSQDVTLRDISIRGGPGMGFYFWLGRGVHLAESQVDRAPGHPISVVADAVHFGAAAGDILIENNAFAYQGDDGTNINTSMSPVAPMPSCSRIPAQCAFTLPDNLHVRDGDQIALFTPETKFVVSEPAKCVNQICNIDTKPIAETGGILANLSLANARFIIRGNKYTNNRARGLLLQTPYGLVQNNVFSGQTLFALYFVNSSYWNEGPGAQNIQVLHNQISGSGVNGGLAAVVLASEGRHGVISSPAPANTALSLPATHQDIVFADNTIRDVPGPAFYISSSSQITLDRNKIQNTNTQLTNPDYAIKIHDSSHVLLRNNVFSERPALGTVQVDGTDAAVQ